GALPYHVSLYFHGELINVRPPFYSGFLSRWHTAYLLGKQYVQAWPIEIDIQLCVVMFVCICLFFTLIFVLSVRRLSGTIYIARIEWRDQRWDGEVSNIISRAKINSIF
ncbi:hypothetical protein ACJX0J_017594, partial [Zea mays]